MYTKHLAPALRKAHPAKRKFVVLEDNDPMGYKSRAAIQVKKEEKIDVFEIPKRSPDLNPLDYGFWAHVKNGRYIVIKNMICWLKITPI